MRELLIAKFDILLLAGLLMFFAWYALHGGGDFAQRLTDGLLGALLTLITGRALHGRQEDDIPKALTNKTVEEITNQ